MDDGSEALNQNLHPIHPQNFLVIRDDYFVHLEHESPVFPPNHHEDSPLLTPPHVQSSDESESSEPSESSSPKTWDLQSRAVGEAIMRRCKILKAKVISGFLGFGSYAVSLCSVLPVTAMAALLVILLLLLKMKMKMRLPWRSPNVAARGDNEERLLYLLKDKDEKISQLLLQIAQMNETLSARRKVPVVRIK